LQSVQAVWIKNFGFKRKLDILGFNQQNKETKLAVQRKRLRLKSVSNAANLLDLLRKISVCCPALRFLINEKAANMPLICPVQQSLFPAVLLRFHEIKLAKCY